jgi:hypothetical protein
MNSTPKGANSLMFHKDPLVKLLPDSSLEAALSLQ